MNYLLWNKNRLQNIPSFQSSLLFTISTDCEGERQMSFIENYKRARRERL